MGIEWKSVNDELPESGEIVLVHNGKRIFTGRWWRGKWEVDVMWASVRVLAWARVELPV